MSDPEASLNILIVRTDRIGDVILTLPLATVLKRKYPDARIAMLVREYTKPLVANHPDIDEVIVITEEKDIRGVISLLKQKRFSSVYLPSPSFTIARAMRSAGIPKRIGTAYRWYSSLFFTQKIYDHRKHAEFHEAVCNVRMVDPFFPATPETLPLRLQLNENAQASIRAWLEEKGIMSGTPYAIVHPGSGGSAKDWTPERFAHIAMRLREELGYRVVFTGTSGEANLLHGTEMMTNSVATLAVGLPLDELAALIAGARCVMTNSTGVLHIAAAVGTYVAGIYPPILACSPKRWGPWTNNADVFVPPVEKSCKNCADRTCPFYYCMNMITVENVMSRIRARMAMQESAGGA